MRIWENWPCYKGTGLYFVSIQYSLCNSALSVWIEVLQECFLLRKFYIHIPISEQEFWTWLPIDLHCIRKSYRLQLISISNFLGKTSFQTMAWSTNYTPSLPKHMNMWHLRSLLIAKFMGPTWGPSGADRTQVGPMLAPWTLLSGIILFSYISLPEL